MLKINNGNNNVTISRDQTVKIGRDQKVDVEETITVTAGTKMLLKVGESTITMTPSSIEIKTPSLTVQTQTTQSQASVAMNLKGTVITLN